MYISKQRSKACSHTSIWPDALLSLLIVTIMAYFSSLILEPKVGFDDANITQAYARNIAAHHGYVYNVNGERVEGSTSAVWTLINYLFFAATEHPEKPLAVLCAILSATTVFLSIRTTRELRLNLYPGDTTRLPATAIMYLAFPAFFGWTVWSLTEFALWVLWLTWLVFLAVKIFNAKAESLNGRNWHVISYIFVNATLSVIRPEGIVVALGMSAAIIMSRFYLFKYLKLFLPILSVFFALVVFGIVTVIRLFYFGYPVPNTFYAKMPSNVFSDLASGLEYTGTYFLDAGNLFLVITALLGVKYGITKRSDLLNFYLFLSLVLCLGTIGVYTFWGGDHFAAHRLYLHFLPVLLPIASLMVDASIADAKARFTGRKLTGRVDKDIASLTSALLVALVIWQNVNFGWREAKGLAKEFRVAESGRRMGNILNTFPGNPTLGVIAAGGIRMTYKGVIYDLMGLNWAGMAHAEHNADGRLKGHSSFNRALFFEVSPDIFYPSLMPCSETPYPTSAFLKNITGNLTSSDRFRKAYRIYCWKGLRFYISRAFYAKKLVKF